jgi:hypothetical protein
MIKDRSTGGRCVVLALLLAATASAQVVFGVDDLNPAVGTGNVFPFNQPTTGYTTLNIIKAAQIHAAGVAPGAALLDLAVAPTSTGTFNAPAAQILVGHLLNDDTALANQWSLNLDNPAIIHDPTFGAYTFPYTSSVWNSLPGVAGAGFVWDGVRDVGIYVSIAPGVTGGFAARRTGTNPRYGLATYLPVNQTPSVGSLTATKFRCSFSGTAPTANTPGATFTLNGTGSAAILDGGDLLNVAVSSTTAPNAPFLLLLSSTLFGGNVPLTGQALDLGNPAAFLADVFQVSPLGFVPLNSGAFNVFGSLNAAGAASFSFPMPCLLGLPRSYAQVAIFDPTHPDGIRLSGAPSFNLESNCRYAFPGPYPVSVPDAGAPVVFSIVVPPGLPISDVDVVLEMTHTNYTDFVITLDRDGTLATTIKNAATVDTTDLSGRYRFSDEGASTLAQAALLGATLVFNGTYIGDNALAAYDGLDAGAVWYLTVSDAVAGGVGSIQSASLVFNGLK